jgi:small subunit ribosomal protein S9
MGEAEEATTELAPEVAAQPEAAAQPAPGNLYGTGRRKTSVARVFLRPGSGQVRVNSRPLEDYFKTEFLRRHAREPLDFAGAAEQYDATITVKGGGPTGQAGAVRLGLARALAAWSEEARRKLRQGGFLTRDSRMKERKKYGQKGARKRFQWTKR